MTINTIFPGFQSVLNSTDRPNHEAVIDDIEGEQETLPELTAADHEPSKEPDGISHWRESITGASKGVTDKTDGDYERYSTCPSSVSLHLL